MRRNRAAFDQWAIVPRMAAGAVERALSVQLLGARHPALGAAPSRTKHRYG
jgi:lactate 2-monooxygenase